MKVEWKMKLKPLTSNLSRKIDAEARPSLEPPYLRTHTSCKFRVSGLKLKVSEKKVRI